MTVEKDPARIRRMFAEISPHYDFLNHFLSLNLDRRWRRQTVASLRLPAGARVLDLCTGTGDLALAMARDRGAVDWSIVGSDFTLEMLRRGETKRRHAALESVRFLAADALALPFADASFDAVTVAFGIRNVVDLGLGMDEMRRVLKPGGQAAILEFSPPRRGVLRGLFEFYFRRLLPAIGRLCSGSTAYSYLPQSVSEFPSVERFVDLLVEHGFERVRSTQLTLGVAVLHLAWRALPVAGPALLPSGGKA